MADGGIGAGEYKVVWQGGTGDGEVGFGLVFPLLCQGHAVPACDGVVRDVRDVEAGCADEDVEVVVLSVLCGDACLGNACDGGFFECDGRQEERFEISFAWGQTSATQCPSWDEFFAELRVVVEGSAHSCDGDFRGFGVVGGIFTELKAHAC